MLNDVNRVQAWFSEIYGDIALGFRLVAVLDQVESAFQSIVVVDTLPYGKILAIDGCVMTSERDEFVYHEMLVHPALVAHSNPESVCIIGGGDGGTAREVLKHPDVKSVVVAELDAEVVRVCTEHFPALAGSFSNPTVNLVIGDGFEFLKNKQSAFDAILSDSIDPAGPGEILFSGEFFKLVKHALRSGGVFVTQSGPFWNQLDTLRTCWLHLSEHFRFVRCYSASIPTYPTGTWCFLLASDTVDPMAEVDPVRRKNIAARCRYYTEFHQQAAFVMPAFVKEALSAASSSP
ncbi:polyamine aminopropyltransferase [bacterium]|nr:polyamine aminopropyltransferase [bacterium]MBU1984839.1 polyamine aminopropyltransferase [bacterium]